MSVSLNDLRRYAVARSLFAPTGLVQAVRQMGGFVQADPLRVPARARPDAAPPGARVPRW